MDRCMTETSMIKEYPDQDKRQVACKLRFTANGPETVKELEQEIKALSESFTMKDDPDFSLSAKELDMVAKAVGLKDQKPKAKKKR
jgi:hypothetical protein